MKKVNLIMLSLTMLAVATFFFGCMKSEDITPNALLGLEGEVFVPVQDEAEVINYTSNTIPGKYIVVYKKEAPASMRTISGVKYNQRQQMMRQDAEATLAKANVPAEKLRNVYSTALKGFSVELSEKQLNVLKKDTRIDYIEQDQIVTIAMGGPPGGGGGGGGGQVTPWGITRVGGAMDGTGKRAWIIDSGIDLDHPDLNVNVALSKTFLGGNTTPDDQNGHGTHVAGTVAAIDNNEGVVGVAAGAEVVSVRVLDRRGSGSYSGVIAGVDYVGANASSGDAANMSLGGGVSQAVDDAVKAASSACAFVLAAGNESTHANNSSPARVNGANIYTVSSMAQGDNWSSFSNYGNPPVDYCAPGSSINSTWKAGGYNTISGTSMAAPHVCGILLLGNISSDGKVNGDPDGNSDNIAHH